jgi:hypothetical protein
MEEAQNRCLFEGSTGRGARSCTLLLLGRESPLLWPGRYRLTTSLIAGMELGLATPLGSYKSRNGSLDSR